MYQINKAENNIQKLKECSFSELGFKERGHLQEWIDKNPDAFGEELLIIQKEFSGFDDTKERLDLLALDKQRNLVIIENKLDDSGKDVTWQALKYASYCSSLTTEQIKAIYQDYLNKTNNGKKAETQLSAFFDDGEIDELTLNQGSKQRIMMVAAKFRKEVTSTVIWLMNYKMRIQCFKVTPYSLGESLFLNIEQILPVKEVEEYSISMAEKNQNDIASQERTRHSHAVREKFWKEFIDASNQKNELCQNLNPSKETWIGLGIGVSGLSLDLTVTKNYAKAEIYINRGSKEQNKEVFNFFYASKEKIEDEFGKELIWDIREEYVTSGIKIQKDGLNVFDENNWDEMIEFLIENSEKLVKVFRKRAKEVSTKFKRKA